MDQLSIELLAKALSDKTAQAEVGSARLRAAIRNAAEEKAGVKPTQPMSTFRLEKGEAVPRFLAGSPGLHEAAGMAAAGNWSKSWIDVSVWTRIWCNSSAARVQDDKNILRNRFASLAFSEAEIAVLRELDIEGLPLPR